MGIVFFLLSLETSMLAYAADPMLRKGDFVAIAGDSITEQRMYSAYVEDYLLMCQPAAGLRACQFGCSGQTSTVFAQRMANNLLPFKPNVVTVCFGSNNGGFGPTTPEDPESYRDAMRDIVRQMKKSGVRVIVIGSPVPLDTDRAFNGEKVHARMYDRTLAQLRDIAGGVAKNEGVVFANIYDVMTEFMAKAKVKFGKDYFVLPNGGNPEHAGSLVMAYVFLKAMGCDGKIGTITVDMDSNKADATDGHKILSCNNGRVEVQSSRYPFCFFGEPGRSDCTRGVPELIPFNEDLNRFQLRVLKLGAPKAKVTWGTTSKEFTSAQLENGINLAAEFLDNPFSEVFRKIDETTVSKQWGDMVLIKEQMDSIGDMRGFAPNEGDALDRLATALVKRGQENRESNAKAVVPIKHVLLIESVK
jgi:lysophospholipase L1-like esterase